MRRITGAMNPQSLAWSRPWGLDLFGVSTLGSICMGMGSTYSLQRFTGSSLVELVVVFFERNVVLLGCKVVVIRHHPVWKIVVHDELALRHHRLEVLRPGPSTWEEKWIKNEGLLLFLMLLVVIVVEGTLLSVPHYEL